MSREPGTVRPYITDVDFLPKWHLMDIESDVDEDDGTKERTLVLPIRNRGILVRIATMDRSGSLVSESLTFVPNACIEKQVGKRTGRTLGLTIGSKGSQGSITAVAVSETPEFLAIVAEEDRIEAENAAKIEAAEAEKLAKEAAAKAHAKAKAEAAARAKAEAAAAKAAKPAKKTIFRKKKTPRQE